MVNLPPPAPVSADMLARLADRPGLHLAPFRAASVLKEAGCYPPGASALPSPGRKLTR